LIEDAQENDFTRSKKRGSIYAVILVKFLISGGILWFLLSRIGWESVFKNLSHAHLGYIACGVILLLLQFPILAAAWRVCLRFHDRDIPYLTLLRISTISLFFNQVAPASSGGIVARTALINQIGVDLGKAFNSVVLDRICNVLGLMIIVFFSLFLFYYYQIAGVAMVAPLILLIFLGSAIGILIAIKAETLLSNHSEKTPWRQILWMTSHLRLFLTNKPILIKAVSYNLLWHVLSVAALFFCALALGIEVGLIAFLASAPVALFLALIPISVAGWGVREGVLVTLLGLVGVEGSHALTLSLTFGVLLLATRLTGIIPWMTQAQSIFCSPKNLQ